MGRYVRNALEEQIQCNATQQCNTKDIFKLKPKCNATQQCNGKICEKCPRGKVQRNAMQHNFQATTCNTMGRCEKCLRGKVQCNTMQYFNTEDIFKLKPKCNAMQRNSATGRYVTNALEEQVQRTFSS